MSSDPLAVTGEQGVVIVPKRPGRVEYTEVFFQFRLRPGRGERDRDGRVLENEAVPVRGAGRRASAAEACPTGVRCTR